MPSTGAAPPAAAPRGPRSWLLGFGIAAVVAGIRLLLVSAWAGDAPYLDDWNGTGWLHIHAAGAAHGIPWAWLVYPHADHLLVVPRLWSLALAALNGNQWDVRAELAAATLLWGVLAGTLVRLGRSRLPRAALAGWIVVVLAAEALPHAWENLLWAFQSAFILVILLSLAALRLLAYAPLGARWWWGALCGGAATVTMASGALVFPVAAVITCLPGESAVPAWRRWTGVTVMGALTLAARAVLPTPTWMAELHATTASGWFTAFARLLAWPWSGAAWLALILWIPAGVFVGSQLRRIFTAAEPRPGGDERFALALVVWSVVSAAASAWARGAMLMRGLPPSRYGDVLVIGVLVNSFLALAWASTRERTTLPRVAAWAWVGAAVAGIFVATHRLDREGTAATTINTFSRQAFTASRPVHEQAIRNYLATRDPAVLSVQPPIYPVSAHLAELIERLERAHRFPATLRPTPAPLPFLSRLARSGSIWGGCLLAAGFLATLASFGPRDTASVRR